MYHQIGEILWLAFELTVSVADYKIFEFGIE